MANHNLLTSIMVELVELIGDDLGIQFRSGTDKNSQPYKTDKKAHAALFARLDGLEQQRSALLRCIERDGADRLRRDLKNLLDIETDF